jgi:hypothetical protein
MSAASKARWREQHAELRREYERVRARRRRSKYVGDSSYYRYENSLLGRVTRRIAATERRLNRTAWEQQPENRERRNELSRAAYARRKADLEEVYS